MSSPPITSYQIGIVCALSKETKAVIAMLDDRYEAPSGIDKSDSNSYILGRIHKHNVVLACLPAGNPGPNAAAVVATDMLRTFSNLHIGLMVGIGGGIPNLPTDDIRLGDVVVSQPDRTYGGVVQHDLGKCLDEGKFERKGSLDRPPSVLLTALSLLQAWDRGLETYLQEAIVKDPTLAEHGYGFPGTERDQLYCAQCDGSRLDCKACENGRISRKARQDHLPVIHFGTIASGNQVVKDTAIRDRLRRKLGAKCVEMQAAGVMNDFRCIVIRGICNYADSHKMDEWQEYAALTAAACAKELLYHVVPKKID